MKAVFITFLFSLSVLAGESQTKTPAIPDATKKIQTVETSCGLCQFGMKAKDCSLAVRIDGKSYFVDGTSIDEHGDAHAKDGFCEAIRKAEVQGDIVDTRFKATYFKLLPPKREETKATGQ